MVVFVDLENDVSDDPHADPNEPRRFSSLHKYHLGDKVTTRVTTNGDNESIEERLNPNINSISAALGAYPYVRPFSLIFVYITLRLTDISNPASSLN